MGCAWMKSKLTGVRGEAISRTTEINSRKKSRKTGPFSGKLRQLA